jgi:hypothetical protein
VSPKAKKQTQLVLSFDKERETKRFVRFAETTDNGDDDQAMKTLYLHKTHHKRLGKPESLTVTIEKG